MTEEGARRQFQGIFAAVGFVAAALTVVGDAHALQQPDGTTIPVGNSLQTLFDSRMETIDALADAVTVPETFIPSCALTFEVVQRNAGFDNSFGWYNVTGSKPADTELYEFLACTDDVGTIKQLDIKNDPNYLGGEIGFYQAAGPGCPTALSNDNIFYSEKAYNPDSQQANPYIHLLTYNSTVEDKAFYFAWEDLLVGNDNDFDDLTTYVTGITCSGGGIPCDTGSLGVCAKGILQCQSGMLECIQVIQPTTEACDGFDNDCNDEIDEGDLCDPGEVCDKGNCVPACGSGEFSCPGNKVCENDLCVDPNCVGVDCPSGTKCDAGQCVGPCDNVVCPYGQYCELGVCLDPCGAVTCDSGQVCVDGICSDPCACTGCDADEACQPDGLCIPSACVGVTCGADEYCNDQGMCISLCAGAVCPSGQICQSGQCIEDPNPGTGGNGTGGSIFMPGGNGTGAGSGSGNAGGGGAGSGAGNHTADGGGEGDGCGCRIAGNESGTPWLWFAAAGAVILGRRRRATNAR